MARGPLATIATVAIATVVLTAAGLFVMRSTDAPTPGVGATPRPAAQPAEAPQITSAADLRSAEDFLADTDVDATFDTGVIEALTR